MPVNPNVIDAGLRTAVSTAKVANNIGKVLKRNSIMQMAAPGMYQYPILISNGVESSVIAAIAKAFQLTYAASVCTAYSLNPIMYLKHYDNVSDFVSKFHTRSNADFNYDKAASALGFESSLSVDLYEDAEVKEASVTMNIPKNSLEYLNRKAWDRVEESLDTSCLNDMYRPYDRTRRILEEKVSTMKAATEAGFEDRLDKVNGKLNKALATQRDIDRAYTGGDLTKSNRGIITKISNYKEEHIEEVPMKDKDGNYIRNKDGSIKQEKRPITHIKQRYEYAERKFNDAVVRNDKLEAMEPTMVNVEIVCHGGKDKGVFNQRVTLGVKAMARVLRSDVMIACMVEACQDSNAIFRFLKMTTGETKTIDFVLGISAAKKKALVHNAKNEVRILRQSRKRKQTNLIRKALNNEYLPTLTIVLTTYEVDQIKKICGVDLDNLAQAINLMNKYFLLALAIYDIEQNTLKTMFDCDDDWSYVTVGQMTSMINKTTDLLNQNEVMRLLGRR